jgi:Zn-dependent M28 family amino/carboxypeptidase
LNTIATKTGAVNPDEQVIICAHMDDTSEDPTNRAPGADDNGSGTVAVIETARIFADVEFHKTIKFCLWTGEEQGLNGSAAYASDASARGDNIIGVYNFDMIAWDGNDDFSCELHCGTMSSSQDIGDIFEEAVSDYDINLDIEYLTWGSTDRSDHASFWDYDYPAILGIEDFGSDFHPYYHTTLDNMDNINQEFFYEYTKGALAATATLADPTMTDVDEENPSLPSKTSLIGSYPNPFNNSANIVFNLAKAGNVKLDIYNLSGQKIKTIVNGKVNAGIHTVTWNGDDYSSGIYFYKLSANEKEITKRMTLLK